MPELTVPSIALHDGVEIPQLGFGVFQVPPEETQSVVELALDAGYRHIDTAAAYRNEAGVGAALAASGLPREDVFVTTKLWNTQQGHDSTLEAFDASLDRLGLEYVDLYLIHWPVPSKDRFVDTWRAFERILEEGRARTIGVSNFRVEDLERLARGDGHPADVNQVELHPRHQQAELRAWHAEHGIVTEAWSPLAQGDLLDDETIVAIAERHGKTPAQAILRWHLQLGNVVIPKSVTPERIRENLELFDFELSDADLAAFAGSTRPADRSRPSDLRRPLIASTSGCGGPTPSPRPRSSSAARCSRSARRWPRRASTRRPARRSTCVGGVFFSTGGYTLGAAGRQRAAEPADDPPQPLALVVARAAPPAVAERRRPLRRHPRLRDQPRRLVHRRARPRPKRTASSGRRT